MSIIDSIKNAGSSVVNHVQDFGEDAVSGVKHLGSEAIDDVQAVGSALVRGAEFTEQVAVKSLQFQADVVRAGLEKTFDAGRKAGTTAIDFARAGFDSITHPGDPNPPAAQGLKFSETKSASDLAYDANKGDIYRFPDGKEWEVVDVKDDPKTSFRAIALQSTDPNDNRTIVAFAGSGDGKDWKANIGQGLGLPTKQYRQAVEFADKWKAQEGNNVILTGHSLGGGLASYASIKTGLHATAVNAAPLALNHLGLNPRAGSRITQYFVPGEALTAFTDANPVNIRPGNQIAVRGKGSILDPRSIGSNHAIGNVAPDIPAPVKVN